jgi:hypothetical protein
MKEINLHAALWAIALLASWTFWIVYHNLTISEYKYALLTKDSTQQAIQACLDKGFLFHSWPDRFGAIHVKCKLKDPPPIFATYKEYKRYMRAVGGG